MIVCHCRAVNHTTVQAAAVGSVGPDGSVDVDAIGARCGAGTGCGACVESVVEIASLCGATPRLLAG